ncbi:olfactory receptor 12D1-like [Eudromia elegans]
MHKVLRRSQQLWRPTFRKVARSKWQGKKQWQSSNARQASGRNSVARKEFNTMRVDIWRQLRKLGEDTSLWDNALTSVLLDRLLEISGRREKSRTMVLGEGNQEHFQKVLDGEQTEESPRDTTRTHSLVVKAAPVFHVKPEAYEEWAAGGSPLRTGVETLPEEKVKPDEASSASGPAIPLPDDLNAVLGASGQCHVLPVKREEGPSEAPGWQCEECNCQLKSESGLSQHKRHGHPLTRGEKFILVGLSNLHGVQQLLFLLFLLLYVSSVLGNVAILLVVVCEPQLHTPMYFFLFNLSCLDIFYSTFTVPKRLASFLLGHPQDISYTGCLSQLHFFHFLGSSKALLLAVVAYDHFVAICHPLCYTLLMSSRVCLLWAAATWATGFLHALMHTLMTSWLHFCWSSHIQHFLCNIKPVVRLACNSNQLNLNLLSIVTGTLVIRPFVFTLFSYLYIVSFLLLKVQCKEGRRKAFSTCISHLTVVTLLYVPVISNYVPPSSRSSPKRDMIVTLMYNAVTCVLNPLIYTLRNVEVKHALKRRLFSRELLEQNMFCHAASVG